MFDAVFNSDNYFFNPYATPYYLVGILTLLEGIFVFAQNRKSRVNFSYALSCVAVMLWLAGVGLIYSSSHQQVSIILAKTISFLGIIFITPTIHFFSVCWQERIIPPSKIRNKLLGVIFNFYFGSILYILCINTDFIVKGIWQYPWGFYPRAGNLYFILVVWFLALMSLAIKNFTYVYQKEKMPARKKQAQLIIIAFSVAFIGSLEFLPNYGFDLYLLAFLPVFFCISTVGYSIIRYRLMDIETVVHKTAIWFLTNLVLITPFALLVYNTRLWIMGLNQIGIFIYLVILFLLFLFSFRALQPKLDRIFQRERFNLEQIAIQFTEELIHLKGFPRLIQRIEDTIKDTLYAQEVDIYIYNQQDKLYRKINNPHKSAGPSGLTGGSPFIQWLVKNNKIIYKEFVEIDPSYDRIREEAKDYFNLTKANVAVPLVLNEQLIGIINLGKKANLKRYRAVDFNFLTTLRNQSTIAISNALLFDNMEEQVRQRTKELVEMQKQLIQAEKMASVGTLAGGVAHEINNPLTAILTNVQMLLSSDEADKLDRESLELIEEATKRCRNIVQKLMAYSKKPLKDSAMNQVDLAKVVKSVISFIGYQLEQDNIKLIIDFNNDNHLVMGNQNELEQVMTNILLNARDAIKHIKKSGDIHLSIRKDENWVKIEVRDEGLGIASDNISKIFDPFFTTKDIGKGTGLGLSICQAIIEKHNGRITVKSEVNKGSVFTVELPKINL